MARVPGASHPGVPARERVGRSWGQAAQHLNHGFTVYVNQGSPETQNQSETETKIDSLITSNWLRCYGGNKSQDFQGDSESWKAVGCISSPSAKSETQES